jgi:hypothetical protein
MEWSRRSAVPGRTLDAQDSGLSAPPRDSLQVRPVLLPLPHLRSAILVHPYQAGFHGTRGSQIEAHACADQQGTEVAVIFMVPGEGRQVGWAWAGQFDAGCHRGMTTPGRCRRWWPPLPAATDFIRSDIEIHR